MIFPESMSFLVLLAMEVIPSKIIAKIHFSIQITILSGFRFEVLFELRN